MFFQNFSVARQRVSLVRKPTNVFPKHTSCMLSGSRGSVKLEREKSPLEWRVYGLPSRYIHFPGLLKPNQLKKQIQKNGHP